MSKFGWRAILFILLFFALRFPLHALNDVYVVHLVLDGARYDVLNEMIKKGELPILKKYFVDQGATFEQTLTTFPSVSPPAYVSFATGLEAQNSSIFFLEWFDRSRRRVVGYLTPSGIKRVNVDLLNRLALRDPKEEQLYPPTTLFEKLSGEPTAAIYTPFRRGAGVVAPKGIPLAFLWNALITHNGHALNRIAMKKLRKIFSKKKGPIPRYTLVALYGPDFYGHKKGPASVEVQSDLKKFDLLFQQFLETLASRGIQDKTYLILTSDHGMHETDNVFRLRKFFRKMGLQKKSIYIGNRGVSSTILYVKGEEGWKTFPTLERLRRFPVKRQTFDLIQTLLEEEEVGWLAVRDQLDRVHIFDSEGEGLIEQFQNSHKTFYTYSFKNKDPLGYTHNPKLKEFVKGGLFDADTWLRATIHEEKPNAVVALSDLFQNPRMGDILVVAKGLWGFRKVKAGTHGSLSQEDLHIPLWIAGPKIQRGSRFQATRGVDLFPTILSWFGLPQDNFKHQEGKLLFSPKRDNRDALANWLARLEQSVSGDPLQLKRFIPKTMKGPLAKRCQEEATLRRERIGKFEALGQQMADSKNTLGVPGPLQKNMKWFLELETDWERQRLHRMEKVQKILEKL